MENLSLRLKYALKLTKVKKAELARKINVKPQIIQFLCNGSTQSSRYTFEIAKALSLNPEWLALGKEPMFKEENHLNTKQIPVLTEQNLKVIFIQSMKLSEIEFSKKIPFLTNKESIFSLQMIDSSMQPILPPNSYLFFDTEIDNLKNKEIYLIYSNKYESFLVREYQDKPDKYFLPINNEFFNKVPMNDGIQIFGKLVASLHMYD